MIKCYKDIFGHLCIFSNFYCLNYQSYRALKMQGPKHAMRIRVKIDKISYVVLVHCKICREK